MFVETKGVFTNKMATDAYRGAAGRVIQRKLSGVQALHAIFAVDNRDFHVNGSGLLSRK